MLFHLKPKAMEQKICFDCGAVIKGRRDKKFCDDFCRNAHYNKQHCDEVLLIRNIQHIAQKQTHSRIPPATAPTKNKIATAKIN